MMMNKYCFVLFMLFFISCKESKETIILDESSKEIESNEVDITQKNEFSELDKILMEFDKRKSQIIQEIKQSDKVSNSKLYEKYKVENEEFISEIMDSENDILNYFYDESFKDAIEEKSRILNKSGLEFWEVGEGYVEIRTKYDFYESIFEGHLTDDYEDYLEIEKNESEELYASDAALAIPFKKVGDFILEREKFIFKYPQSSLIDKIKEDYKHHQKNYLIGMDNTPTTDYETKVIYPENLEEFNRFIKENPDSPTSKKIEIYIDNHKDKEFSVYDLVNGTE